MFLCLFSPCPLQLFFSADNGVGIATAVYEPEEEAGLCDGQWHTVSAHKIKHRLELVVDGKKVEAASPGAHSPSADTSDPVYFGGYPGTSSQLISELFFYRSLPTLWKLVLYGIPVAISNGPFS